VVAGGDDNGWVSVGGGGGALLAIASGRREKVQAVQLRARDERGEGERRDKVVLQGMRV